MGLSMPWRMGDEIKSRRAPRNPWQALDRYVNSEVNKKTKMKKKKKPSSPALNVSIIYLLCKEKHGIQSITHIAVVK